MTNSRCKTGSISGLLVLFPIVRALAASYAPAALLLGDDAVMTGAASGILYRDPRDTTSLTSASASCSYDDYYHATSTDNSGAPVARADALAESPRFSGEAVMKRPHWALAPSWRIRKGFCRSFNVNDTYFYHGAMNSNKAGMSGWLGSNNVFFAGYIGWNFVSVRDRAEQWREGFPNNLAASNLAREKCDYVFSAGCSVEDIMVSAYLEKTLQPTGAFTIINRSNTSEAQFSYLGLRRTVGVRAALKSPGMRANIEAGLSDYLSDTLSSAAASIPLTMNTRMLSGRVSAGLPHHKLAPSLMLSGGIARPQIRGFDGPGGSLFFNLDKTESYGASVSAGVNPSGKLTTGLFAELLCASNQASGRLDPFLFSSMSLFMPDKYKIDSSAVSYKSYGFFCEKQLKPLCWWSCDGMISASWVRLSAFSKTRKYDFSAIIPRLVDPQKNVFIDEDYALCIVRLANEFKLHKAQVSVTVQQGIPIGLKSRTAGRIQSGAPEANVKRSVRGAARYCAGVGYEL